MILVENLVPFPSSGRSDPVSPRSNNNSNKRHIRHRHHLLNLITNPAIHHHRHRLHRKSLNPHQPASSPILPPSPEASRFGQHRVPVPSVGGSISLPASDLTAFHLAVSRLPCLLDARKARGRFMYLDPHPNTVTFQTLKRCHGGRFQAGGHFHRSLPHRLRHLSRRISHRPDPWLMRTGPGSDFFERSSVYCYLAGIVVVAFAVCMLYG